MKLFKTIDEKFEEINDSIDEINDKVDGLADDLSAFSEDMADAISDIGRGKTEAAAVHHAEQQNKGTGKKKELPLRDILGQLILCRRLRS